MAGHGYSEIDITLLRTELGALERWKKTLLFRERARRIKNPENKEKCMHTNDGD